MRPRGPRFPVDHHRVLAPGRAAVACLVLAAQLWLGSCASVGPVSSPSKRDLVSVAFVDPRPVRAEAGETLLLRSLVGDIESISGDTVFLRIAGATEVDGRNTDPLLGARVTVLRSAARFTVIHQDRSGVTMAATLLATLGAFVAGGLHGFLPRIR